jgi:type IV pilus assembly protein PilB
MRRPAFFVFAAVFRVFSLYPERRMPLTRTVPMLCGAPAAPKPDAATFDGDMSANTDSAEIRWLPLGALLTGAGLISEEQLEQAFEAQRHRGGRLGMVLIELGMLTSRQIAGAVAEQCHLELIDLDPNTVDPEAARLLPEHLARRFEALPIQFLDDGSLLVAIADPTNLRAIDDLQMALGKPYTMVVADEPQLEQAIGRAYRPRVELSVVAGDVAEAMQRPEDIRDLASSTPTINLVNSLLTTAIDEGASDVHFEPKRDRLVVRVRIDGTLRDLAEVPKHMQPAVISRLKIMGALDIAERRAPQDGRVSVHFGGEPLDLRIAVLPLRHGEQVVLRILNRKSQRPRLQTLGLSPANEQLFTQALDQPFGAVVVCGPTGSGKTTTLYGALDFLGDSDRALMTIEDPIEHELVPANQIEVDERAGLSFARGLRTILRSDPDVLLVGEIRDEETAAIAMQAAMTGHLVLTSLHAHNAAGAVARLRDMGVPPPMIASALNVIVAQRLARRLCEECREPYDAPADADPEVPAGTVLYRPVGCPKCRSTGYRGRAALFELMVVRGEVRSLVEASAEAIFSAAVRQGMTTLREDGLRLCREGISSLEEIRRVTGDRLT